MPQPIHISVRTKYFDGLIEHEFNELAEVRGTHTPN